MAYETIILDIEDSIATITLNRPDALNALNQELMTELCTALDAADASDKVRCIIITGSEKAFAAGADITEMAEQSFVDMYMSNFLNAEVTRFNQTRKPIIAAVAGFALGGGCELAMMCDFIIAADTAKFGQPEINLGVIAGAVNRAFETTLAEGINYERRLFQSLFATQDQKEGMAAFQEKREAQVRDR